MSNAVDILVVGGPANGKMVCMPRERMPTYVEYPVEGLSDVARYTRRKWPHPDTGKLYHIATRDEDAVTDEMVKWEIGIANFQPAWDLNRAQVTP